MEPITLFLEAIDRTISFLKGVGDTKIARKRELAAAWQVVRSAVTRTRAYLADQSKPTAKPDRDEERAIATAWDAVGLVILGLGGPASKVLRNQCFTKADYWADPDHWDIRNPGRDISLERVEKALTRLLDEADSQDKGGRVKKTRIKPKR